VRNIDMKNEKERKIVIIGVVNILIAFPTPYNVGSWRGNFPLPREH